MVFDKRLLGDDATLEWVTPGHPLFEAVRTDVSDRVASDLLQGTVLWDLQTKDPYRLDVFTASIKDGRGVTLHTRLFVVRADHDGTLCARQPTLFLDLLVATQGTRPPELPALPDRARVEAFLVDQALRPFQIEVSEQRANENRIVREHIEISLHELINRQQIQPR